MLIHNIAAIARFATSVARITVITRPGGRFATECRLNGLAAIVSGHQTVSLSRLTLRSGDFIVAENWIGPRRASGMPIGPR